MSFRRTFITLVACLCALAVGASFAQAAKAPTYHVYNKCNKKTFICSAAVYLNKSQSRVVVAQASKACSDKSYAAFDFTGKAKVSSKGKFSVTNKVSNYDYTAGQSVIGNGTLTGTVSKKNKVTLKLTIDKVPVACGTVSKLKITAKYKGTQTGG